MTTANESAGRRSLLARSVSDHGRWYRNGVFVAIWTSALVMNLAAYGRAESWSLWGEQGFVPEKLMLTGWLAATAVLWAGANGVSHRFGSLAVRATALASATWLGALIRPTAELLVMMLGAVAFDLALGKPRATAMPRKASTTSMIVGRWLVLATSLVGVAVARPSGEWSWTVSENIDPLWGYVLIQASLLVMMAIAIRSSSRALMVIGWLAGALVLGIDVYWLGLGVETFAMLAFGLALDARMNGSELDRGRASITSTTVVPA